MNERRSVNSEVGEVGRGHVIKSKKKKKGFFLGGRWACGNSLAVQLVRTPVS